MTAVTAVTAVTDQDAPVDLRHHGDVELAPGLIDCAVNVRLPGPPKWLRDELVASFDTLGRYPVAGPARAAVARRHGRDPADVLLTAGAAEAFVLLARALQPRLAACVHPAFTEPEAALRAAGHRVTRVVLPEPFDLDAALVPTEADLVVLGNPTNPTSVLHPAAVIATLARPGRWLVVDEAFADCVPGESQSLAGRADLPGVIVVRSLTKTWGLAGLRIGYLLAAPALVDRLADAQPRWSVSAPALIAAQACSSSAALAEASTAATELAGCREQLAALLADLPGLRLVPRPAASFLLLHVPDGLGLRARLRETGVAVRRADTFPGLGPNWLRVTVRDRPTNERVAAAFAAALHAAPRQEPL